MITLVTVTYNAASTIERTLLSVERQTYRNVQHIIMDGGSKDDTVALAEAYRMRNADFDVIIVSEPDKGLYDAMNKAVSLAKGDYVCFLNAGDKLHADDTLQHIADKADADNVGIIYGNTDIVDDMGNLLRPRRLTPPDNLTWKSFRHGMLVCHQSFYVNRRIMQKYDLTYRFSADFDWCIRCMKQGKDDGLVNIYIHEPLTDYLSEGMTTANHKASLLERYRIMCRHYGWFTTIMMHLMFVLRGVMKGITN